jgi:hypothetical protein
MNLDFMNCAIDHVTFYFQRLLKTSRSNSFCVKLEHFEEEPLWVFHTLLYYVNVTRKLRRSKQLSISYVT